MRSHQSMSTRVSVELSPDKRQRGSLDSLFAGPILVVQLLRAETEPIERQDEASRFLLRNKQALEPYLFTQDRSQAVDLLTSLVLQWSNDPPEEFEILFQGDCSISPDQRIFLPVARLGLLSVSGTDHLQNLRRGTQYEPNFALLCSDGIYRATIPLKRSVHLPVRQAAPASTAAENREPPKHLKPKRKASFQFSNFLALFNNRVAQHYAQELRVSKQLSTVQFGSLSGKPVQGGLPSLGKRR